MIWLYAVAVALPWSALALAWLGRVLARRRGEAGTLVTDPWRSYLLFWSIAPMVFFTASGNILATYVLPGIPAFALLVGDVWQPRDGSVALRPAVRALIVVGMAVPVLFIAGILALQDRFATALSHKALVATWSAQRANAGERLVYLGRPPPSADFYARGHAIFVPDVATLAPLLDDPAADFIALHAGDLARLPDATRARLVPLGEFGDYWLLREAPR